MMRITKPSELIHFLHDSVTRHHQHLSDPTAWPRDIFLSNEGIRSDKKAIKTSMPQQVFDHGFWRNLMDYSHSGYIEGLLLTVADAHGLGIREARGEFFEEVVNTCQAIQTMTPTPRWWQRTPMATDTREFIVVSVRGVRFGQINVRRTVGRIVVTNITP